MYLPLIVGLEASMSTVLIALLLGQAAAFAESPPPAIPLPPAGKWVLEYNEGNCTISRPFGDLAHPVTFAFQPVPTAISGDLYLILPGGRSGTEFGTGTVTLTPGDTPFEAKWINAPFPKGRHAMRFRVEQPFWEALSGARTISFYDGKRERVTAALDSVPQMLSALKACGDDLLRHWGADPAAMLTGDSIGAPASWLNSDDYPPDAIRTGQQGRVQGLATFDPAGRPIACRVVVSSGVASLDKATCSATMKRARAKPAADGPQQRFLFMAVNWMLPSL